MDLWKTGPTSRVVAISALILACACAPASTTRSQPTLGGKPVLASATGWATFTDPTETAFTVSAPSGWQVKGGVKRISEIMARPWVTAASADGLTSFFRGDPSLPPFFVLPDPLFVPPAQRHADGDTLSTPNGPTPVRAYQPPEKFAADYARKTYGSACSNLQPLGGSRAEPELASHEQTDDIRVSNAMGSQVPASATDFTGASVRFSCQGGGTSYVVAVFVVMAESQIGSSGLWSPRLIFGYRAPMAQQDSADQIARAVNASFQRKPDWDARMIDVGRRLLAQQKAQFDAQQRAVAVERQPQNLPGAPETTRYRNLQLRYIREDACPTAEQAAHEQCVNQIRQETARQDPQ